MAEELINNPVDDVKEPEVNEEGSQTEDKTQLEVNTDDVLDSSGNKPDDGPSVVRKAMEKLGILKPSKPVEDDKGKDIPDDFIAAAKANGWEDKDIEEFASDYTDEQLKEMLPFLLEEEEPEPEPEVKPVDKKKESPSTDTKGDTKSQEDLLKAAKDEIRKEFQGEIDNLKEKLGEVDKTREAQRNQDTLLTVNTAFDEAGKQFEVFGKTEDLPVFPAGPKKGQYVPTSPQMKARSEVWVKASAFINAGMSAQEAMEDALTWYKGKHLEKDVKRGLIKDLKRNEQKLSAKRSSKETAPVYEDEDERRVAFIRKEAERLGIKLQDE